MVKVRHGEPGMMGGKEREEAEFGRKKSSAMGGKGRGERTEGIRERVNYGVCDRRHSMG